MGEVEADALRVLEVNDRYPDRLIDAASRHLEGNPLLPHVARVATACLRFRTADWALGQHLRGQWDGPIPHLGLAVAFWVAMNRWLSPFLTQVTRARGDVLQPLTRPFAYLLSTVVELRGEMLPDLKGLEFPLDWRRGFTAMQFVAAGDAAFGACFLRGAIRRNRRGFFDPVLRRALWSWVVHVGPRLKAYARRPDPANLPLATAIIEADLAWSRGFFDVGRDRLPAPVQAEIDGWFRRLEWELARRSAEGAS